MAACLPNTARRENRRAASRRAQAGRLMVVDRNDGTEPRASDFFTVDSAGSHPLGLLATGIPTNERGLPMMTTTVREATEAEATWLRSKDKTFPQGMGEAIVDQLWEVDTLALYRDDGR